MATRTRSGRLANPPQRYVPVETITDDFNDDEYDSDDPYGTKDSDFENDHDEDEDDEDEEDDDDDEGSLKDFIASEEDEEDDHDDVEDEFVDDD